jgi:hypothetical protein
MEYVGTVCHFFNSYISLQLLKSKRLFLNPSICISNNIFSNSRFILAFYGEPDKTLHHSPIFKKKVGIIMDLKGS